MKARKAAQATLGMVMALVTVPALARTVGITADAGTMGFGVNVGTQLIQNTLDLRTGYTQCHFLNVTVSPIQQ